MKKCSVCGVAKSYDDFHKKSCSADGLRAQCKPCRRLQALDYAKRNPEKVKAASRRWANNNRARCNANHAKYIKNNPQLNRDKSSRRRARVKQNGIFAISKKELQRLYASPCFSCGSSAQITMDHIIPIDRGGTHSIGNLMPLCRPCNSSKHDRTLTEWKLWKSKQQSAVELAA